MEELIMKKKVGVIVGRFQMYELTAGHRHLINRVIEESDELIIYIGYGTVRSPSNVFKPEIIETHIHHYMHELGFEDYTIAHLHDQKDNQTWINILDKDIEAKLHGLDREVTMYGSRDSFLTVYNSDMYTHKYSCVELPDLKMISASELRADIKPMDNQSFKKGMIYAVQTEFPAHYAVVDAIITDGKYVLLGKKKSGWYLPGGFADAEDFDLEAAVLREVREETKLARKIAKYFMSHQCKDWRYRKARQPFTSVFIVKTPVTLMQAAEASDDLDEVIVILLEDAKNYLLEGDAHLMYIQEYLKKRDKDGNI